MPPRLKTALALAGSFALGGGLLYLTLRGVDRGAVAEALGGAAWGWLGPLALASAVSVVARAWRWTLLLEALPEAQREASATAPTPQPPSARPGLGLATASVLIGYMVNYAAPRLGEVVRTAHLASRARLPLAGVLGTVVAERVLDVAFLGLGLVSVALLYRSELAALGLGDRLPPFLALSPLPLLLALGLTLALLVAGGLWLRKRALGARAAGLAAGPAPASRKGRVPGRLAATAGQFRAGLLAVLRASRRGALLGLSAVIWASYALMAYFPLRLLGLAEGYGLGLVDAWALMIAGAVGMALPAPGGTGTYHYATQQAFGALFGVPEAPAAAYAILAHAAQLAFYCAGGFAALVWQGTSVAALRRSAQREAEA